MDTRAKVSAKTSVCDFDAAIFDMDGVVTETANLHAEAWKLMFDEYLVGRSATTGSGRISLFTTQDYRNYVDGRPRYQGVQTFLQSRGINLPYGTPADQPQNDTVCGLGNRKNEFFNRLIERSGARVFESSVCLIEELRRHGVRIGLATSSKNSALILSKTKTEHLFSTIVDGVVSERLGLKGKPHADIFVTASRILGVAPDRAVVLEDAVSGVKAGAAGGFSLVIGVAREGNAGELLENGADVVVGDLGELSVEEINRRIRQKSSAG